MNFRGLLGALLALLLAVPLAAAPCGACLPGHCDHSAAGDPTKAGAEAGHAGHGAPAAQAAASEADAPAGHCASMRGESPSKAESEGGHGEHARHTARDAEPPLQAHRYTEAPRNTEAHGAPSLSESACCAAASEAGGEMSAVLPISPGPRAPASAAVSAADLDTETANRAYADAPPPFPPPSCAPPLYRLHDAWLI